MAEGEFKVKGGKKNMRAGIDRLQGRGYGGGFLDQQYLDPQVMQQMQQVAMGQAPSAAEQLMRASLDKQQAGALGMAAGAPGMPPALAMRLAQQTNQQTGLQSQAQFGAMRADEMARAQQAYQQAQLQQGQLQQAGAMGHEQLLNQLIGQQYQGWVAQQGGDWGDIAKQAVPGLVSGVASGGAMALFSDARLKDDIQAGGEAVDAVLRDITPYTYTYTDRPDLPKGERLGVLAQDLASSKLGRAAVVETPAGLGVDVRQGLSLVLAAVARLNERLDKLEEKIDGK